MEHITVLSIEQIHELRARYQRAKPVVMLDPEPPFDSCELIEIDTGKMLQPGLQPSEYARPMMVVYDRDEAERLAHVDGDVVMLCELALELYARVAALPPAWTAVPGPEAGHCANVKQPQIGPQW